MNLILLLMPVILRKHFIGLYLGNSLVPGDFNPGRSNIDFVTVTVDELLPAQQIGFRSLTEAIDTTTPGGKLVFHIIGALTEFERSVIRERTNVGLVSARARGKLGGHPPAWNTDDITAAKALLRNPKITVEKVAKRLGVAPSTLYHHIPGGCSAINDS